MARDWKISTIKDGQQCIELRRWTSFRHLLKSRKLGEGSRVWRGQAHDWPLVPSILRVPRSTRAPEDTAYRLAVQLTAFKFLSASINGAWENESDEETWAFGQHHGLATPLLDWTTSPYVAAFFAYLERPSGRQPAVFALCRETVEAERQSLLARRKEERARIDKEQNARFHRASTTEEYSSAFFASIADFMEHELKWSPGSFIQFVLPDRGRTQRLASQASLFARLSGCKSIEEWVTQAFAGKSGRAVLVKILLPPTDREEALRELNSMNVNHLTLFPDVQGVAMYCNLALSVPGYDRRFLMEESLGDLDRG